MDSVEVLTHGELERKYNLKIYHGDIFTHEMNRESIPMELQKQIDEFQEIAVTLDTAKIRSELLVAPILSHFWKRYEGLCWFSSGILLMMMIKYWITVCHFYKMTSIFHL